MSHTKTAYSPVSKVEEHGKQKPRISIEPAYVYTDGGDAAELVSAYGFTLDPWQQQVINSWLGRDKTDHFTATSAGLSVPRQNGKNALLEVRELYGMVTMGEKILHTAHEVKTARKAFLRLAGFFENERQYPELAAMVVAIRKTNGQEAIELDNKGSVEFSARSRGAARGFTVDTVVFDEAQELTDEQLDALLPTLAAAPSGNRQYIYTGTPPSPACSGEVFRRTRETALSGADKTLAWHEWSVENIPASATTTAELVKMAWQTNPAMGYRIDEPAIEKEALAMSLDGFARERLGWWVDKEAITSVISHKDWDACLISEDEAPEGNISYGVKFSLEGDSACISCAVKAQVPYVELINIYEGAGVISQLAQWLYERKDSTCAVAIDGRSGQGALINALFAMGYPRRAIMRIGATDAISAASGFLDAVRTQKVTHIDSPALDESVTGSCRRAIGSNGGWGFGDSAQAMSAPAESAALALFASQTTRRNPSRKMHIIT